MDRLSRKDNRLTHTHHGNRKSETSPISMELPHHHPHKEVRLMPWYNRALCAINTPIPFFVPTQATNLALLVSAIPK